MEAIRIIQKCRAAGRHCAERAVLAIPADISAEEARRLVRMGRAVGADLSDFTPETWPEWDGTDET